MATIREKIYLRMRELGVKQIDLARRIGIQPQNFSTYIKGRRTLPFADLEAVCMELGLTLGRTDTVYHKRPMACSGKK